jgi:hypothetical protein
VDTVSYIALPYRIFDIFWLFTQMFAIQNIWWKIDHKVKY